MGNDDQFLSNLGNLADNCKVKTQHMSQRLNKEAVKLEGAVRNYPRNQLALALQEVAKHKKNIHLAIDNYFNTLEQSLRNRCQSMISDRDIDKAAQNILDGIHQEQQRVSALARDLNSRDNCLVSMQHILSPQFEIEADNLIRDVEEFQYIARCNQVRIDTSRSLLGDLVDLCSKEIFIKGPEPINLDHHRHQAHEEEGEFNESSATSQSRHGDHHHQEQHSFQNGHQQPHPPVNGHQPHHHHHVQQQHHEEQQEIPEDEIEAEWERTDKNNRETIDTVTGQIHTEAEVVGSNAHNLPVQQQHRQQVMSRNAPDNREFDRRDFQHHIEEKKKSELVFNDNQQTIQTRTGSSPDVSQRQKQFDETNTLNSFTGRQFAQTERFSHDDSNVNEGTVFFEEPVFGSHRGRTQQQQQVVRGGSGNSRAAKKKDGKRGNSAAHRQGGGQSNQLVFVGGKDDIQRRLDSDKNTPNKQQASHTSTLKKELKPRPQFRQQEEQRKNALQEQQQQQQDRSMHNTTLNETQNVPLLNESQQVREFHNQSQQSNGFRQRDNFRHMVKSEKPSPQKEREAQQLLSNIKDIGKKGPVVLTNDSFDTQCNQKWLHFFQDNSKKLHILDLEECARTGIYRFHEIALNIDFKIPIWHRSIITPQGQIYLVGGSDASPSKDRNNPDMYVFDNLEYTLKRKAKLNYPRNSHGICIFRDHIYVVGGCIDDEGYTNKCERYEISKYYEKTIGEWEVVGSLNQPAFAPSLANFNDTYLYKFGGIETLERMSNVIERYDYRTDKWTQIHYQIFNANSFDFSLMAYSACAQINENEMYVFGGAEFDTKTNQSYVVRNEGNTTVVQKCEAGLPYFGTFWNSAITYQNKVYCLQNVQLSKSDAFFLGKRKLLCYDGSRWRELVLTQEKN